MVLEAVCIAREWIATDEARRLIVSPHLGTLVPLGSWPEVRRPSRLRFRQWLRTTTRAHPGRPLLVPIVWRDHYSALLVPGDGRPSVLMDPHRGGNLGYTPAPIADIRAVLGPVTLAPGGPLQRDPADVFCVVWTAWWLGNPQPVPDMASPLDFILSFLRGTVFTFRERFLAHCRYDEGMTPRQARTTLRRVLSATTQRYVHVFQNVPSPS